MNSLIAPEFHGARDTRSGGPESTGSPFSPPSDFEVFLDQVERIMQSRELSGAEVLRRLLRFLADKTVSGEADELKEYTVAIDGLGKPPSYDPRHTSSVRIQVGRLRQKLIDYYRGEGFEDSVIIGLPKGHFRLTCKYQGTNAVPLAETPARQLAIATPIEADDAGTHPKAPIWKRFSPVLLIAILSLALNVYFGIERSANSKLAVATAPAELSEDLKELWSPFIVSKRPLNLVLEDPLFVEFKSGPGVYYRDKNANNWSDISGSPEFVKLRAILNNPNMQPSRYYMAYGNAQSAFLIGRLFGPRNQNFFSLLRASEVSSTQLANNNILSVGIPISVFNKQLQEMPVATQFLPIHGGIKNIHPKAGESAFYADQFQTAPDEEGQVYALVSHFPGPLRNTDVESFVSDRASGYVGAVQAFINPDFAGEVVRNLKAEAGGKMPRYFQVVLKVTFRDSIPTETTCVLVREVR